MIVRRDIFDQTLLVYMILRSNRQINAHSGRHTLNQSIRRTYVVFLKTYWKKNNVLCRPYLFSHLFTCFNSVRQGVVLGPYGHFSTGKFGVRDTYTNWSPIHFPEPMPHKMMLKLRTFAFQSRWPRHQPPVNLRESAMLGP